ncbi:MAG: FAD-dependent oxidoreductase [Candidatus Lernaella stagnicola]|nr:FAD-dependent oxidoreductase [Candidatus Lernaella stagnicola]
MEVKFVEAPATRHVEHLIIGGGPVGIQAARLIKHHQPDADVLVVRPEPHSLVYCAIPYAIEGLFPLSKTLKSDTLITEVGAKLVRGKAVALDVKKRVVTLENGDAIEFKKLLLATGATPFVLPVPGVELDHIFTVKTAADATKVIEALTGDAECYDDQPTDMHTGAKKAVVIGAGAIGLEQALAYRTHNVEVHLVDIMDHPLPMLIDPDMSDPITKELRDAGVHLHLGTGLKAFHGDTAVAAVELSNGTVIDLEEGVDFVIISAGMRPDIALVAGSGIETDKDGIVVDSRMETNIPGIWAAGDCTQFHSAIDGGTIGGKLATNAVPMAKVAALNMVGKQAAYDGFFNGAITIAGKVRVGGTGFSETMAAKRGMDVYATYGASKTRFPMMPGSGDVRVKLIFRKGNHRIVGGQVVGSEGVAERIDLITLAIQTKLTAADLAKFSYSAQPWQTFFPAKNAIVEAAEKAVGVV